MPTIRVMHRNERGFPPPAAAASSSKGARSGSGQEGAAAAIARGAAVALGHLAASQPCVCSSGKARGQHAPARGVASAGAVRRPCKSVGPPPRGWLRCTALQYGSTCSLGGVGGSNTTSLHTLKSAASSAGLVAVKAWTRQVRPTGAPPPAQTDPAAASNDCSQPRHCDSATAAPVAAAAAATAAAHLPLPAPLARPRLQYQTLGRIGEGT